MKKFRLYNGEVIDDIFEYMKEYLSLNPDVEIVVGTDSEQYNEYTTYVTVIGFIKPHKGVHLVYTRNKIKKIKDLFSRLWNEIEYTRFIADNIEKNINNSSKKLVTIHIDINNKLSGKSNIVHDSAVGYLKSLGYDVKVKPNSWAASKAADSLC
jgi:predicted RNase H-related nuclease YkuK (DUF458 family)